MSEMLRSSLLPLLLTFAGFQLGLFFQKKFRSPIFNPIIIAAVFVLLFLRLTGLEVGDYRAGCDKISWLLTPATIALAVPLYEQFRVLKKELWAILAGVAAGTVACLLFIVGFAALVGFDRALTISLLPKSVTTAIGVPLSELSGGMASVTAAAIVLTGIPANVLGPWLIRLFRLRSSIAQGVALGTAGHVIATGRANELSPLTGAVSSLSLVTAGLLTAVVFPLVVKLIA